MKNFFYKFKIYGFKKIIIFAFAELKNRLLMQLVYKSFSQKGEDIMIDKILGNKKMGCYIDIGANDPHRFNNTKRFYNRGWTGVNIEPDPKCYQKIVTNRKRDINLNLGNFAYVKFAIISTPLRISNNTFLTIHNVLLARKFNFM